MCAAVVPLLTPTHDDPTLKVCVGFPTICAPTYPALVSSDPDVKAACAIVYKLAAQLMGSQVRRPSPSEVRTRSGFGPPRFPCERPCRRGHAHLLGAVFGVGAARRCPLTFYRSFPGL